MQPNINWLFYKNASSVNDTLNPFANIRGDIMSVEVSGNASGFELVFEGKADLNSDTWTEISGISLTDFSITTKPSKNGIWEIGIEGLQIFRVRLISISSGEVTVMGRVISSGE